MRVVDKKAFEKNARVIHSSIVPLGAGPGLRASRRTFLRCPRALPLLVLRTYFAHRRTRFTQRTDIGRGRHAYL